MSKQASKQAKHPYQLIASKCGCAATYIITALCRSTFAPASQPAAQQLTNARILARCFRLGIPNFMIYSPLVESNSCSFMPFSKRMACLLAPAGWQDTQEMSTRKSRLQSGALPRSSAAASLGLQSWVLFFREGRSTTFYGERNRVYRGLRFIYFWNMSNKSLLILLVRNK